MYLEMKVFGEQASQLAKTLGLDMKGDRVDVNTKVFFTFKPVEGHDIVEVEMDVP